MAIKEINVASWNILIEGWKDTAKPCLKGVPWEKRRELIIGRVLRMGAHIICMQEVDRFNSLAERMAQVGYYGIFAARNNGQKEGCALFYKHQDIEIRKINEQEQQIYFFDDGTGRMIQKISINFLPEKNSPPITFLNTHLVNTHSYQNQDEGFSKRAEELKRLAIYATQCSEKGNSVIVCGDLNVSSEPGDRVYLQDFRNNGFIDSFDGSLNAHKPTVLFSGTHQSKDSDVKYRRIDFVFSKNIQCLRSDVRGDPKNLENANEPSDHLAILCHYAIPKEQVAPSTQQIEITRNQAQNKLEEGIDINEKIISKIKENINEIVTGGNGYAVNVPRNEEIQWISRENFFVFSLKSNPRLIFKLALPEIKNAMRWDSNGKLMNSQEIIEERFSNMIRAKQVCLTYQLDKIVIPCAKKFSVDYLNRTMHFIAEERLDFDHSGYLIGPKYNEMLGDGAVEQAGKFVAETGLSDVSWRNMSILLNPSISKEQKQIVLFDLEFMGDPQTGFFGDAGSVGLIRCLGSEKQINIALDMAKQYHINPPNGMTFEKLKAERLSQIAHFKKTS